MQTAFIVPEKEWVLYRSVIKQFPRRYHRQDQ